MSLQNLSISLSGYADEARKKAWRGYAEAGLIFDKMLEKKSRIQIFGTITRLLNDISSRVRILPIEASIAVDAMGLELEQGDPREQRASSFYG